MKSWIAGWKRSLRITCDQKFLVVKPGTPAAVFSVVVAMAMVAVAMVMGVVSDQIQWREHCRRVI